MASAHSVEFIFHLIDKFTPVASQLANAARRSAESLAAMGKTANSAESAVNKMAAGQQRVANAFNQSARAIRESDRAHQLWVKNANQVERMQLQMLNRHQAKQGLVAAGMLPGQNGRHSNRSVTMDMMNAYYGFQMAGEIRNSWSHFIDIPNAQFDARRKMAFVGFKGDLLNEADVRASSLSRKYRNLSKADVLEQLYEGVAIHGDARHALDNIEAQSKLASFLQSWEGGKHAHNTKAWNREVFSAIKSMEMFGVLNNHDEAAKSKDINNYLGAFMSMKALYGDQARIGEYLTMQRRAGSSFYNLSDEFRFGVLPAILMEKGGSTVGQQIMTGFQSVVGGKKLSKNEMATMRGYGLMGSDGRWVSSLVDAYKHDGMEAMKIITGAVARKHGLDLKDPSQREKLKDMLPREMSWLFPNRNAASYLIDMFMNEQNYKKHAHALMEVRKEMERIANGEFFAARTKGGAEASVAKQWENLMAAIGGPIVEPYIERMNNWAASLNRISEAVAGFFQRNPAAAKMFGTGAVVGVGALASVAALAAGGFVLAGLRTGLGLLMGGGAFAAAAKMAPAMMVPAAAARGAMAMAPAALAGAAAATAATRVGLLSRVFSGLAAAVGLSGRSLRWFHMVVNGMMGVAGRMARVLKTTLAGFGLALAIENWRSIVTLVSDLYTSIRYFGIVSKESGEAFKKFIESVTGIDLSLPTLTSFKEIIEAIVKAMSDLDGYLETSGFKDWVGLNLGLRSFTEVYGLDEKGNVNPQGNKWFNKAPQDVQKRILKRIEEEKPWWLEESKRRADDRALDERMRAQPTEVEKFFKWWNGPSAPPVERWTEPPPTIKTWSDMVGKMGNIPQSEAQREINIRTQVDVTQRIPLTGEVNVKVDASGIGRGTAPVTGAAQGQADAPRGESAPVTQPQ